MKTSLVLQPLRAARWTLAALAAGLAALMLVATSAYKAFGGGQILSQLLSRMPRAIRTIAGDENALTAAGYFSTLFFHPLALIFKGSVGDRAGVQAGARARRWPASHRPRVTWRFSRALR